MRRSSTKNKLSLIVAIFLSTLFVVFPTPAQDAQYLPGGSPQAKSFNHAATQAFNFGKDYAFAIELAKKDIVAINDAANISLLKQLLATLYTFTGNYDDATRYYLKISFDKNIQDNVPKNATVSYANAVDTIVKLTKGRRAVFINENHGEPITRVLPLNLLPKLKEQGFTYLALEALTVTPSHHFDKSGCIDTADASLCKRGYPLDQATTGIYSHEPVYGELIRTALSLGFRLVAYDPEDDTDEQRDRNGAERLAKLFADDPNAKLIVLAGEDHIAKESTNMAQVFRDITSIDPLTVDQAALLGLSPSLWGTKQVLNGDAKIVYVNGRPFSSRPGAMDISIYRPPYSNNRKSASWLTLGGQRVRTVLSKTPCRSYPCLLSAHLDSESPNSVPSDRFLLQSKTAAILYLRPGFYTLSAQDARGVTDRKLQVGTANHGE